MNTTSGLTLITTATTAGSLEPVIDAVELLYLDIDREAAAFSAATAVVCPDGCGRCCRSETVEASVLEMLPMARALFRTGLIDAWEAVISSAVSPGQCLVFATDGLVAVNGRCRLYGWRPLVCRLFGFAARKSKTGQPVFRACREFSGRSPASASAAATAVAHGLPVPVFAAYHMQVASLHATVEIPLMPINTALQQAVNRYGLCFQMALGAAPAETPQDDPHRGPEGRIPPRLAA